MEIAHNILATLVGYPKSSLLFLVAIFNLLWLFYFVMVRKGFKEKVYRAYIVYALFSITWVISNAYFQSQFLVQFGPGFAKFMALLANVSASSSIIGFYYISCAVKRNKVSLFSWILMTFLWIETILFNVIPGLTVKEVLIFGDNNFQLVQGRWTGIFFLIGVFVIFLSFINFILAIRRNRARIENVRVFYLLFGMILLYSSIVVFLVILPFYFQNYNYAWVPPFMSLADVLIVGYAIITQRFIDIRTLIGRFFKTIVAFGLAIFLAFLPLMKLARVFNNISLRYWEILGIAVIILFYNKLSNFLNSRLFYRYFGGTDAEHIKYITNDLRKKSIIYRSVAAFEQDIQLNFKKKLRTINPQITVVDASFKKKYPKLVAHFSRHTNPLVTEELKFDQRNQEKMIPLLSELESLGGICFPLFNPSKGLIGIFTMGQKHYNHLYKKEEVAALESLSAFVGVMVNNILYSSELQLEVDKKTKELKNKIQEVNELVEQQSDFIAVTAHEFRTPLTIASFQIQDLLHSTQLTETQHLAELKIVDASLENLKQLTEKLFAVQQYDLNQVSLKREKIELSSFLRKIYDDFIPIMAEKNIDFVCSIPKQKKIYVNIDVIQIRQVMHNILRNAYKFTPEKGSVLLKVESPAAKRLTIFIDDNGPGIPAALKKTIFEKFRTKSSGAGIGLGLYLCKKIVELHKGKLWVEDAEKGGSSFRIQLNLSRK